MAVSTLAFCRLHEKALAHMNGERVLDLGCGNGFRSAELARRGFAVTCVDKSAEAIQHCKSLCKKENIEVDAVVRDIKDYRSDQKFDLVMSFYVLHFLDKPEVYDTILQMKKMTSKNGLNAIAVFTRKNPEQGYACLFKSNELRLLYCNWKIIEYREFSSGEEEHDGLPPHRHHVAFIIAQKNSLGDRLLEGLKRFNA